MYRKSYCLEEKMSYVEEYKNCNVSLSTFSKENSIPESTLRGWLKEDQDLSFGAIELEQTHTTVNGVSSKIVFACENIRIELKKNFDKNLFKKIVEVLLND
ncbi:MAG: hypothetical protein RSE57_06545 [Clostridia bacterium]